MNKLLMRITVVGGLACGSALALASAALKPSQLASSRGGADTTTAISDARLNATVTNNTTANVSSGNNTIDSGSFANHERPADGDPEFRRERAHPKC